MPDLYLRPSPDREIPKLVEGQTLELEASLVGRQETQPPRAVSQAKLIEMMEERGLGTKATRADISRSSRPRLRLRQPARPLGDRDRAVRGLQELRAGDGDAER